MRVIELLKFNKELLEKLQKAGIKMKDSQYVELYADFLAEKGTGGGKVTYAVVKVAERYGISERKVYELVKRFESDCKINAVQ